MTEKEIFDLIDRYNQGTASPEECGLLESWYLSHVRKNTDIDYPEKLKDKMDTALPSILTREQFLPLHTKQKLWLRITAAAALLIALGTAIYFYQLKQQPITGRVAQEASNIQPGGNKAYLTLSDGRRISLSDAANGTIGDQNGILMTKTADGQLLYEIQEKENGDRPISYNRIETPNGGQYQVRLPDGTLVWLNATSSLRYPTHFVTGQARHVELSGEGYFEVAKDQSRPFIVSTEKQEVEVLGTHFNITAYKDDSQTTTTLLEGRVRIKKAGVLSKILIPGEQAINTDEGLRINKVNTSYAVDWKNGYFRFNEKNLKTGLEEIARWYNVEVSFKKESLKNEPLAGRISKYDRIEQVLKKMELTGMYHFTIKGREIIVE